MIENRPGRSAELLTKTVLENALQEEMTQHLTRARRHAQPGSGSESNVRNGYPAKTVRTGLAPVELVMVFRRRDRDAVLQDAPGAALVLIRRPQAGSRSSSGTGGRAKP